MRAIRATAPDAALAVVLAVWWLLEVGWPDLPGAAFLVLTCAPIAWRRTAPVAATAVVATGFVLSTLAANPPEPLAQLLAVLIASYSAVVHPATGGAAALGCILAVAGALTAGLFAGDDVLFLLTLSAVACAAGAAVRRLGSRSSELEERAARLDQQARTAAAEERERIARELHDIVSHSVSLMVVQAGAAEQVLLKDPGQAQRALDSIQVTGRAAVDDLRRMLGLLRGADDERTLAPQPGLEALRELADSVSASGTPVELELDAGGALPPGIDLAAYRIVQEAVTNAAKHAPGCATTVRVECVHGRLLLEARTVSPPSANGAREHDGHGLIGMRERVAVYGGELEAGRDQRSDWVVRASIPLTAA